jgi:general secretion pathway protein C
VNKLPSFVVLPLAWLSRRWIGLTTLCLLVLFSWLAATWTWIFWPKPKTAGAAGAEPLAIANPDAGAVAARHFFGDLALESKPEAPVITATPLNVKLKGVFAGLPPFPAFAIVSVNGKDQPVKVGTEVMPGVMLDSVFARHVLLRRAGTVEKVEFEEHAAGSGAAPVATGSRMPRPQPQPQQNPQFKLNVEPAGANNLNLSRAELNQSLQDPKQLQNIGRIDTNPGGGVGVQDVPQGSLFEKLGLQQGDVVRALNGVPVNSQADLMRLYQQFSQVGQVRVDGTRAGAPLQLNYNIRQ